MLKKDSKSKQKPKHKKNFEKNVDPSSESNIINSLFCGCFRNDNSKAMQKSIRESVKLHKRQKTRPISEVDLEESRKTSLHNMLTLDQPYTFPHKLAAKRSEFAPLDSPNTKEGPGGVNLGSGNAKE
jgi:hypothetical protein